MGYIFDDIIGGLHGKRAASPPLFLGNLGINRSYCPTGITLLPREAQDNMKDRLQKKRYHFI